MSPRHILVDGSKVVWHVNSPQRRKAKKATTQTVASMRSRNGVNKPVARREHNVLKTCVVIGRRIQGVLELLRFIPLRTSCSLAKVLLFAVVLKGPGKPNTSELNLTPHVYNFIEYDKCST
jgi:hypothetical protein